MCLYYTMSIIIPNHNGPSVDVTDNTAGIHPSETHIHSKSTHRVRVGFTWLSGDKSIGTYCCQRLPNLSLYICP